MGDAHHALLAVLAEWKADSIDSGAAARRLQQCAAFALDRGDITFAWECALMSLPERLAELPRG